MNQLLLNRFLKQPGMMIVVATTIIYGIIWGLIYLIFAAFHGMPEMFNDEFSWILARLLNVQLNSIWEGFLFAILEGSLLGLFFGFLLLKIYRRNND